MNREILFRGKPKENSSYEQEWVYGVPVPVEHNTYPTGRIDLVKSVNYNKLDGFIPSWEVCNCEIKPETLGEYTGLKDRNGNRIFEGDILSGHLDDLFPENETRLTVVWHETGWFGWNHGCHAFDDFENQFSRQFEIIGNIHDNPELIKGVMKDD